MTRIFLASSKELDADRRAFELDIARRDQRWSAEGYRLHTSLFENGDDAMSATRKQDDYNAEIAAADLFVLLVHTKVGRYAREEFEIAWSSFQRTGRPRIYTYFKALPEPGEPAPGPGFDTVRDLLARLAQLQHWPNRYDGVSELLHHFGGQLDRLRAKGLLARDAAGAAAPADPGSHSRSALEGYLNALVADLGVLRLGEIDASTDRTRLEPLELADVYVPLYTDARVAHPPAPDPPDTVRVRRTLPGTPDGAVASRQVSAVEALCAHRRMVLLGPPGSGKSTFGAKVLLGLAQARLRRATLADTLGPEWTAGALLPVRIVLREFAERCAARPAAPTAGDLWEFVGDDLRRRGWGPAEEAMKTVRSIAWRDGVLVLFDGLDECGDERLRALVLAAVEAFIAGAGEHSHFLLTARPYAFAGGADARHGVYQLAALDDAQIELFIDRWYAAVVARGWESAADVQGKRADLRQACRRADLRQLAGNPLLLTLMTTLHSNRGRLPDDRAELYEDTVTLLMQRWNRAVGADRALLEMLGVPGVTLGHFRAVLQRLAFEAHEAGEGQAALADIAQGRLLRAFEPLAGGSLDKAREVVNFIERRAGLLQGLGAGEDGEPRFSFPHRTFQEFLAACHLKDRRDFTRGCRQLAERAPRHWREVLVLAARLAGAERGAAAACELVGPCDEAALRKVAWDRVALAAWMLCEIGARALGQSEFTRLVADQVRAWLLRGLPLPPSRGGAPIQERTALGDALWALGDPRFDEHRCGLPADDPMLGFVPIDTPPRFAIARFPVTVAQFRAFLLAQQCEAGDPDALREPGNRPVRWISWREALAYAGWLTDRLRQEAAFDGTAAAELVRRQGWRVALPSADEWALAARAGGPASAGGLDDDTPAGARHAPRPAGCTVGCQPADGAGLHGMAGPLREWTRSVFVEGYDPGYASPRTVRETEDPTVRHLMMLRGGPHDPAGRRHGDFPWAHGGSNSVRLVLLPPGRGAADGAPYPRPPAPPARR